MFSTLTFLDNDDDFFHFFKLISLATRFSFDHVSYSTCDSRLRLYCCDEIDIFYFVAVPVELMRVTESKAELIGNGRKS